MSEFKQPTIHHYATATLLLIGLRIKREDLIDEHS